MIRRKLSFQSAYLKPIFIDFIVISTAFNFGGNMTRWIWVVSVLLFCTIDFSLSKSHALGVGSSGGGRAYVCREPSGKIVTAQLYDLFEAQKSGYILKTPLADLDQEYTRYLKVLWTLAGYSRMPGATEVDDFHNALEKIQFEPEVLPIVDDLGTYTRSQMMSCDLEQAAIYFDSTDVLRINQDIWNGMDSLNKVALYAHETIYRTYRRSGENSSKNVRKLVGRLFAAAPLPPTLAGVPEGAQSCWTGDGQTHFYYYPNPETPEASVLQFEGLFGRWFHSTIKAKLNFAISSQELKLSSEDARQMFLSPINSNSNFEESHLLESPIFDNYRLTVIYKQGEPFVLRLDDGSFVQSAVVTFCSEQKSKKRGDN